MKEIVALKDGMVLDHPVIGIRDKGLESYGSSDPLIFSVIDNVENLLEMLPQLFIALTK